MKLTPHEQKILKIISKHPEIVSNPKERAKIAKENNLTEKTLRNRIAELKKRGLVSKNMVETKPNQTVSLDLDIESVVQLILKRRFFIVFYKFYF